ncbi:MAG: tripartite tricarboxylate transporter TctB family protein [Firmicutes bacterium]|jgi:hypothetical protein|nr:tripartite tricarboxylate transporter TctB family protein [Bacillota bacterium]
MKSVRGRFGDSEFLLPVFFLLVFLFMISRTPAFHPRARLFPTLLLGLGILLATTEVALQLFRGRALVQPDRKPKGIRREFWLVVVIGACYMLSTFFLGFYIPSLVYIPLCMWSLGVRRLKTLVGVTMFSVMTIYLVFGYWLSLPTPRFY